MGFLPILALIFITLKLMGYILWSWWWVLSPILILPVLFIVMFLFAILVEQIRK